jgi:hypothetical protein
MAGAGFLRCWVAVIFNIEGSEAASAMMERCSDT